MKEKSRRILVLALAALFVIPFVLYNCEGEPKEDPKPKTKLEVTNIKNGDKFKFTDEITIDLNAQAAYSDFKLISNNKTLQEQAKVDGQFTIKLKAEELVSTHKR